MINVISLACSYYVPRGQRYGVKYKEVQFHDPICLDTDVETLVLNRMHKNNPTVRALATNFESRGIKVIYTDA